MPLSRDQQARDRSEAIEARRQAAELLRACETNIDQAKRKLRYNKSSAIEFELGRILNDIKEQLETLEDPEYDPD